MRLRKLSRRIPLEDTILLPEDWLELETQRP